jgi:hypothetical protein
VTYSDDYQSEMTDRMPTPAHDGDQDDLVMESMLSGDGAWGAGGDLATLLGGLRELANGPVPQPTDELATLLSQGLPGISTARRRARRRKIVAGVVIGGVASLGLTGVAAANDRLPSQAQKVVSQVVENLTQFHVDHKQAPTSPASVPSHARPTDGVTAPNSAVEPTPGKPSPSASDDKGGVGSGSDEDSASPTPRPSEASDGSDDHGDPTSGANRESSDPPVTARPTGTTGSGTDGSGSDYGGHHGGG